jgi:hypothetical protein
MSRAAAAEILTPLSVPELDIEESPTNIAAVSELDTWTQVSGFPAGMVAITVAVVAGTVTELCTSVIMSP